MFYVTFICAPKLGSVGFHLMPFPYLEIPCTTIEVKIRIREVFIAENRKKGKGRIFKIF